MGSNRSAVQRDIHRRLAIPESPAAIASAVGVALRTVYRHRSGRCLCGVEETPVGDQFDLDLSAALAELGLPTMTEQMAELDSLMAALSVD